MADEVIEVAEQRVEEEVSFSELVEAERACQMNVDDVIVADNIVAEPTATYEPGKWYTGSNCKGMMDWCISNGKPFFAFYTNVSGGCTFCENWDNAVINTSTFKNYMKSANLYFGYYDGAGQSDVIDSYITKYAKGSVSKYPYGFFYRDSSFHEYFERPGQQKTQSKSGRPAASISTAQGLINLCKQYEFVPIVTYTVTFKDWNGSTLKSETVEIGKSATPPANPLRAGYTFTGWQPGYTNITSDTTCVAQYVSDGTDRKQKLINSHCLGLRHNCRIVTKDNITLYYVYSLNQIFYSLDVKISFNGNGSTSGSVSDVNAKIGGTWTCPSCSYKRTDYEFEGYWTTSPDGSGAKYYPGSSYSTPSAALILYAAWKETVVKGTYVVLASTETSPGCSKLTGMINDVSRVKAMLPSSIPASNIIELKNSQCTTANIKNHLEIGKDYELLIYLFSDHGSAKDNGAMCTYDGRFKSADFYDIVSRSKGRVFAIFACCHAEDQYKAVSPYAADSAGNTVDVSALSTENAQLSAIQCDTQLSVQDEVEELGQYDWAQGAIDYFEELKKKQEALRQRMQNAREKGLLMASSPADNAILAANAEPNMLCWCACKKAQVSYMTPGTGHYFITGLVKNFSASKSYSQQWNAFANKSPAKGTTDGNTYTPVKAVLGNSFESNKVFT